MKRLICLTLGLLLTTGAFARDLDEIIESGTLRVGTTGDYKPFSFRDGDDYEGFDVEMAERIATALGVELELVETSWPTLMEDLAADRYDIGMSGISRTVARQLNARFSQPYLTYGKTPLVHVDQSDRFGSLEDIDQEGVKIGVNPGGTNYAFVQDNIENAEIIVIESNLAIPVAVAEKEVDVMLTDSPEAIFYSGSDERLAAPLAAEPFTRSQLAYLMAPDAARLQDTVDFILHDMELTGALATLQETHSLIAR